MNVSNLVQPVTEQRLEQALHQVAQIVSVHGKQYMPVFERLVREVAELRIRRETLSRVMASIDPPTIDLKPVGNAA